MIQGMEIVSINKKQTILANFLSPEIISRTGQRFKSPVPQILSAGLCYKYQLKPLPSFFLSLSLKMLALTY
jgi:hypothetical protein